MWMDQILEWCSTNIGIHNDFVVVYGKDDEDPDHTLIELMHIVEKYGLVFNSENLEIKMPQIEFYGVEFIQMEPYLS